MTVDQLIATQPGRRVIEGSDIVWIDDFRRRAP